MIKDFILSHYDLIREVLYVAMAYVTYKIVPLLDWDDLL